MLLGFNFVIAAALAIQASAGPRQLTLLQLSLAVPKNGAPEHRKGMEEEAATITSCAEGLKLMDRLEARGLRGSLSFHLRSDVHPAELPVPLRDALLRRPIGRATPVYGNDEVFRVLIRCEQTFIAQQPEPLALSGGTAMQYRPSSPEVCASVTVTTPERVRVTTLAQAYFARHGPDHFGSYKLDFLSACKRTSGADLTRFAFTIGTVSDVEARFEVGLNGISEAYLISGWN
jgi:hypothetical protein